MHKQYDACQVSYKVTWHPTLVNLNEALTHVKHEASNTSHAILLVLVIWIEQQVQVF